MRMRKVINPVRHISFLILLLGYQAVYAQKEIYRHRVFWTKTEINQVYPNKFGWGADLVLRRKNELGQGTMFDQPLRESFRPWVHYQFSPGARFSFSPIGYMHTNEYKALEADFNRDNYHEWRTTFQFFHHQKQLNGKIMHTWRYRYELRWQEQQNAEDYRFFTRLRFRYRLRYVFKGDNFYENNMMYAAISNELGINIGNNVPYNFNQSRWYLGAGIRFANAARIELRYVDRYRARGSLGNIYDRGQGLMIGLYIDQLSEIGKKKVQEVRFYD